MNCQNCQYPNPASAKFCSECGASLRFAPSSPTSNTGSGAVAHSGGVSAGQGGAAISGDVQGDVLINSTKIIYRGEDPAAAQALLHRYLRWLENECAPLKLKAIDQGAARPGQQPLGLTSVYVDLNLDLRIPEKSTFADYFINAEQRRIHRLEPSLEIRLEEKVRLVSVLEALAHRPSLVLLGRPGSGKSTFSTYVALSLAQAGLGDDAALERLSVGWTRGPLLPIRVILRQFAASLPADLSQGRAVHLWQFITSELVNAGLPERTGPLLQEVALKSGALFLLDGLDEAGDENRRARVLEAVSEFTRAMGYRCRFLITARPYAWDDDTWKKAGQEITLLPAIYRLADFESDQIETFIAHWYQAITALGWVNRVEADEKTRSLQAAIGREDLRSLARNPLLLTLIATLHSNRTRLPEDRVDLYNEVVELLLQRWNEPVGADRSLLDALDIPTLKLTDLRAALEQLAFEAHWAHLGREGTADIAEANLQAAFWPLLGGSWDKAALVVEYVEKRAGLLVGQGARPKVRQYTFPHRTFQEYLAACYLAGQDNFSEQALDLAYSAVAHWREVLILAARRAGPGRGVPAADALIYAQGIEDYCRKRRQPDLPDWRAAIIAGEQLLEIGLAVLESREPYRAVRERVAGWLAALLENGALSVLERVRAGDVLARLNDPRDLEELVAIPAGKFWMGSEEERPILDERPPHPVELPLYKIGKYPVTAGQWKRFIATTNYPCDPDSLQSLDNHPAHDVSWHDALAYCDWLTGEWRTAGKISPDEVVRLPTEAEWEKAARSGDKREWPWGNESDEDFVKANTDESGIGHICAVGIFPAGASPYGCLDMAGNVWEWTLSKPDEYPYQPGSKRESMNDKDAGRVLRGGSFGSDRGGARCAFRDFDRPDDRVDRFGFRVCVVR